MKKIIYIGLCLSTVGALLNSCQKKQLVTESTEPSQEITELNKSNASTSEYIYIKGNVQISESEIDLENDKTTLVYDEISNNVYVFESYQELEFWANNENSEFSNTVINAVQNLDILRDYIVDHNVEESFEITGKTSKEYEILFASLFGLNGKSSINILHDNPNATINGGNLWTPISYPKLSSVNFNDKTSALTIVGTAMWLCKNNWYGGSKAFFGALSKTYQNIKFNNQASSVIKI